MQQGADGHRLHLPETACIASKNGACSPLQSVSDETRHVGPAHECCTTIPYTATKHQAALPMGCPSDVSAVVPGLASGPSPSWERAGMRGTQLHAHVWPPSP